MKKEQIEKFIDKYNLGKIIELAMWTVKKNKLSTDFVNANKTLIGRVEMKKFDHEDCEFGIFDTSLLQNIIASMSDDIDFKLNMVGAKEVNIEMSDNVFKSKYVTADKAVMPPAGKPKNLPGFDVEFDITPAFITKFIKGKNALGSESFAVAVKDKELTITIGYANINSNRIEFTESVDGDPEDVDVMLFSADVLKNILIANKDMDKGTLKLSAQGLMKVEFESDDFVTEYYLVRYQQIDNA